MHRTTFGIAGLGLVLLIAPLAWGQADGRAVFVAHNGNLEGSVTAFALEDDGTLTFINRIITGERPNLSVPCPGCNAYAISLSPNGRWLVTGHASSNDPLEQLTFFEVAADGSIAQIAEFMVLGTPLDVAWVTDTLLVAPQLETSPNEIVMFAFDADAQPPTLTEVDAQPTGNFSTYVAVHPTRRYVYVNDSSSPRYIRTFEVMPDDTLDLIDTDSTGGNYNLELEVSPDGTKLYAAGGISQVMHGFHIEAGGTLTPMTGSPFPAVGSSPKTMSVTPDNKFVMVGHGTDATVRSFEIDAISGDLTYTGNVFDVGLQGTLGDVQTLDDLMFVTDDSTAIDGKRGIYSFTVETDGAFTMNGPDLFDPEGISPEAIAVWAPPQLLGDLNCDGLVTAADIDPFVLVLTNPDAYEAQYPDCDLLLADINGDGSVSAADIDGFVLLLVAP
jgi:6-phosphogluconolactonase